MKDQRGYEDIREIFLARLLDRPTIKKETEYKTLIQDIKGLDELQTDNTETHRKSYRKQQKNENTENLGK